MSGHGNWRRPSGCASGRKDDGMSDLRAAAAAKQQRTGFPCWVRDGHEDEDMAAYLAREPEVSVSTDPRWMDLLVQQQRYSELDKLREDLTMAAMLTGEECTLFGRRVRIRLEWVDEAPMTDEQLRAYGEQMKAGAMKRSAKLAEAGD